MHGSTHGLTHGLIVAITSPMTLWTQNTILCTSCITVCSISTFFWCFHSNTWTIEASWTHFTITQTFSIWVGSIRAYKICRKSIGWTWSSFGTRLTFNACCYSIWTSWTFHKSCFIWTTKTPRKRHKEKNRRKRRVWLITWVLQI